MKYKILGLISAIALIAIFIFLIYCGVAYGLLAALEIIVFGNIGLYAICFICVFSLLVLHIIGSLFLYEQIKRR